MKNTQKGIKSLITRETITSFVSQTASQDENTITNPYDIANIFNNNYFSLVAETTK